MELDITSVSSTIISAQAELIKAQGEMDDLMNSDTARANAWIALQDAEDELVDAENYRKSLNYEVKYQVAKITTKQTPLGPKKVPVLHTYKSMPDEATKTNADAELELARAEYNDALRNYEKLKNGASQDDLAIAQAKIDSARATVNSTSILAPFDGEVLYIDTTVGEVVKSGQTSIILADTNHYYVEALVDETDIALVKDGQTAIITSDGLPGVDLTGTVWSINPVGISSAGLVKFTVQIALDPTETAVLLGSTANVTIQVSDETSRVLVPLSAIQNGDKGEFVQVMDNGIVRQVDVVSGDIEGDYVIVIGDLKEGDQVVISHTNEFASRMQGMMGTGSN